MKERVAIDVRTRRPSEPTVFERAHPRAKTPPEIAATPIAAASPTLANRRELAPAPERFIGAMAGNFRLVRLLGTGAMGTVYLGEHPLIGRKVAVKVLHAKYSRDADVISRFFAEGLAVNIIGHANIVQIHDLASLDGEHYYCVMEYLEGQTLAEVIARGPLPLSEAGPIFLQVADALAAAHAKGVVHRDLKPDNIFLLPRRAGWAVKVVDFGVAKLANGAQELGLIGTPHFMAPEQSSGEEVDARADVYALGVSMYYAATCKLPHDGGSVAEILLRHAQGRPVSPRSIRPEIPAEWEWLILKAMEKEPGARFQSMAECAAQLQRVLDEQCLAAASAVRELAEQADRAVSAARAEPRWSEADDPCARVLARFQSVPEGSHYELLGVVPHADSQQILDAARVVLWETDPSRFPLANESQRSSLVRLRVRVTLAQDVLVAPSRRAEYDARQGNFYGVARALAAGLSVDELAAMRSRFLASKPSAENEALAHAKVARLADEAGDSNRALVAYGNAMELDPLNIAFHQRFWALKRQMPS